MQGSTSSFYRDIKRMLKIIIIIVAAIVIIIASYIGYVVVSEDMSRKAIEKEIMEQAIPLKKSSKPLVFVRDEFGKKKKIELWIINDTDRHAIIKSNDSYSVYSTDLEFNGAIRFNHKAGDVCGYSSADVSNGSISGLRCDGKTFVGGPWNKFR